MLTVVIVEVMVKKVLKGTMRRYGSRAIQLAKLAHDTMKATHHGRLNPVVNGTGTSQSFRLDTKGRGILG